MAHANGISSGRPPSILNGASMPRQGPASAPAYSPPVQAILQIGAEANLSHARAMGLVSLSSTGQPVAGPRAIQTPALIKLDRETELCWVAAGRTAEKIGIPGRALGCYENAINHNPQNSEALSAIANILRIQEDFQKAAEFYTRALAVKEAEGEIWGCLGHCFLMTDDLPKAYNCYQQAIVNSVDSKNEPKLWYGIGILYDRYGSLEHAEEAFASVIKMDPNFDKANEIYFRLGIIYKQQKNSAASLQCFKYILNNPPRPLTEIDIWFQIGHVYEQQHDFDAAREAYDRVLVPNPNHAKVLQQLGGLYQRKRASFYDPERSVAILTKSLDHDASDAFTWYLLGRAYMTNSNYGKAYEAYQQAVYRDGKNPAFWCSIGVLYCNINQFHDSLDAYSRAIRINPYLAEVWFNLGTLYESCNDQMNDAVDAYQRTLQLDPGNSTVQKRLEEIKAHQQRGAPLSAPPAPRDIAPSSSSWLLASHVNGQVHHPQDSAPEDASRPTSRPRRMSPPPMQHRGGHPSQDAALSPAHHHRLAPVELSRKSTGSYHSNGHDPRGRVLPPAIGSSRGLPTPSDRPPLPQMRSYDYAPPYDGHSRGPSYSPDRHSEIPPEWMRGKPASSSRGPLIGMPPQSSYESRRWPSPHSMSVPMQMASAPPPPSYGAPLPAMQTNDRDARWHRHDNGKIRSPKDHSYDLYSVGPSRRSHHKSRLVEDVQGMNGRRKASPPVNLPAIIPPTHRAAKLPSDEDNDEGANTLLALAAGGIGNMPQKRHTTEDDRGSLKRPRAGELPVQPLAASST